MSANRQSYFKLHASEVKRLAMDSLTEIGNDRKKHVKDVIAIVRDIRCYHFFGLIAHRKYPTPESAVEHCPELRDAMQYGMTDEITCDLLKNAAQKLLDDDTIPNEEKVLFITLEDFRALT